MHSLLVAGLVFGATVGGSPVHAQPGPSTDSVRSGAQTAGADRFPSLSLGREALFTSLGAGFLGASYVMPSVLQSVPAAGLSSDGIRWSWDRSFVGTQSASAADLSDRTLGAAAALPLVLAWVTGGGGGRWLDPSQSSVVYVETMLISGGLARLAKTLVGRPRPYLYLPVGERPAGVGDPPTSGSFYSMPSGHSSVAWTGAGIALTDHMLRRPGAHWAERFGVGFLGGGFAAATAGLRVEGGQHFPSDVIAGAVLGTTVGIAVPLAHRGTRPLPSSREWLEGAGGVVLGTIVGLAIARSY